MSKFYFKQARHYYAGRQNPKRTLIVIHDMEVRESATTAENVVNLFAGPNTPRASFHFAVDSNSIAQSVKVGDTAWGAPHANHDGVHIEHAGYARQSRDEWLRDDSMLNLSTALCAELIYGLAPFVTIRARFLNDAEITTGCSGLTDHRTLTRLYGPVGGHSDPGPNFPHDVYTEKLAWWLPQIHETHWQ